MAKSSGRWRLKLILASAEWCLARSSCQRKSNICLCVEEAMLMFLVGQTTCWQHCVTARGGMAESVISCNFVAEDRRHNFRTLKWLTKNNKYDFCEPLSYLRNSNLYFSSESEVLLHDLVETFLFNNSWKNQRRYSWKNFSQKCQAAKNVREIEKSILERSSIEVGAVNLKPTSK